MKIIPRELLNDSSAKAIEMIKIGKKIKLSLFLIMVKTQMMRQKRVNVFGQWI